MLGGTLVLVGYTTNASLMPHDVPLEATRVVVGSPATDLLVSPRATTTPGSYIHAPETAAADFPLLILQYCVRCHNDVDRNGNLSLQTFNVERPEETAEIAEKVIRKLAAGMMPPPGNPRPGGDTLTLLRAALETRLP